MASIREFLPPGIYVSLQYKTCEDSSRNLAFDLSITGCHPGVWEATGTISAVDARTIFQSLPYVRDFSDFVTSVNVLTTVLL